ncbi:hypothetical protein BGX23_006513 [Mortierella sp. AD031]|nr:hypothetical protein BGX23_006513 [Mortierella sp. AD031]
MIATPTASTVWDAGHTVTIQWKPQTPGDLTHFEVDLFTGANPTSMTLVAALGTGNPGAVSLTVTLPGRLALSRGTYVVRVGSSYSAFFRIRGYEVPVNPPTIGPPVSTTSSLNPITATSSTSFLTISPLTTSGNQVRTTSRNPVPTTSGNPVNPGNNTSSGQNSENGGTKNNGAAIGVSLEV